jgi:hypothetical protein
MDETDSAVVLSLRAIGSDHLKTKGIYCLKNEPEGEYPVEQRIIGEFVVIRAVLNESVTTFLSLNFDTEPLLI